MRKITVLIADDEELICVLLQKIILWDELNMEYLGCVHDGEELYRAVLQKRPDIVVTDICMPKMDGIELIGKVRKENVPCRFVIVSGYRQFEYAHNALKYNVEDYILKPVDSDELNNTLKKLSGQILAEDQKELQESILLQNSEERIKRFFLNRIIGELEEDCKLGEIEREYGLKFSDGIFQMLHIKSDILGSESGYAEQADSVQNKMANVFQDMFAACCRNILVDRSFGNIRIGLHYEGSQTEKIQMLMIEYFARIQNVVDLFKDYQITLGVGQGYSKIWQWKQSDQEAKYAIGSRLVRGTGRIIYWEKERKIEQKRIFQPEEENDQFCRLIKSYEILDAEEFQRVVRQIFLKIRMQFSSPEMYRILDWIVNSFLEEKKEILDSNGNEDLLKKQLFLGMSRATTVLEMEQAVAGPISRAMIQIEDAAKQRNTRPVRQAVSYIEKHYSEQIRLEDVAAEANLNAAYFSDVFKKSTGENFTDYLTHYRLDRAKDLLREGKLTISQIALRIGYVDTRYFSKLFKKTVGIKPTDYRKIYS